MEPFLAQGLVVVRDMWDLAVSTLMQQRAAIMEPPYPMESVVVVRDGQEAIVGHLHIALLIKHGMEPLAKDVNMTEHNRLVIILHVIVQRTIYTLFTVRMEDVQRKLYMILQEHSVKIHAIGLVYKKTIVTHAPMFIMLLPTIQLVLDTAAIMME